MKNFFRSHPDIVLTVTAGILLVFLISFFSYAINDVVIEVHTATVSASTQQDASFDLKSAATLNLRGLYGATSTPAALPALNNTTTVATTTAVVATSTPFAPSNIPGAPPAGPQ